MRLLRLLGMALAGSALAASISGWAQNPNDGGKLKVYFIDVEGGQATLWVTPANQALLIDAGWGGNEGRDADRIAAAVKDAGLKKIDYALITHYHTDHVGGVPQLLEKVPVGAFIDHGPNREEDPSPEKEYATYEKTLAAANIRRILAKPGDVLPIVGMKAKVVSTDGKLISRSLDGEARINALCKAAETPAPDTTENARSVGIAVSFGKLTILDLGDLTRDKEKELMCPENKLGKVDVYVVSHHGWLQSSSPVLVNSIGAKVAIMNNGARKGGSPSVINTIMKAPELETLWQLHFSEEGGEDNNADDDYIANLEGPDKGNYLELIGKGDGSFDVMNSRTGQVKHYHQQAGH